MDSERNGSKAYFGSSLELKCLFFFGAALALVITISFVLYFRVTKTQIDTQNPLMGKLLAEREFLLIHLRVLLTQDQESAPLSASESLDLNEFIDSMAMQSEALGGGDDSRSFQRRLIRVRGNKPSENDAPQDDFERNFIDRLQSVTVPGEGPASAERTDEDGRYHYYQPLRIERSCLTCHQESLTDSPLALGSLAGVIHVVIPEPPARKEITRLWALLLGAAIITAFLGLIAFYIVIRWVIIKPLRSLRDVSEAISRGDITKRAELHTGDEFETLSVAFNRMLRHLVATQEKLRSTNIELETKVDELAKQSLKLFETNKVKSDFLTTMSHELRTPLNSILGFSEVLGAIQTLDDRQKRYVGNINKSGQVLLNMINDILDMARLEAGRLEVAPSRFKIGTIITAQVDMARPLADRKRLDLTAEMEDDLPALFQDESRIQQIVNNLLSNAIKFTPEGGRIRVEVRRVLLADDGPKNGEETSDAPLSHEDSLNAAEPLLEIRVIDTGVGIAEEDRQLIFEKFRQAGPSPSETDAMTREHTGSGLGLSIVRELCRLLEGEIYVESKLGFGSVFIVILPWELQSPIASESPIASDIREFSRTGALRKPS